MKNISLAQFTLLLIGMFLTNHPALAEERVNVYEMAESGIIIEFKMTPEEIAAEDAENAKQVAHKEKETAKTNSGQRFKFYEMAESGQTVSFPMTSKEIAKEDAENAKRAAIKQTKPEEPKRQVDIYELAESGITIEFPVEKTEKAVFKTVAEKNVSDDPRM
jgi:hypothetical protein